MTGRCGAVLRRCPSLGWRSWAAFLLTWSVVLGASEAEAARRLHRAQELLAEGAGREALVELSDPWPGADSAIRHHLRGLALRESDPAAAAAAWRRAYAIDPEAAPSGLALFQLYVQQERWPQAATWGLRSIDPDRADSLQGRALVQALVRAGDVPLAETVWQRVLLRHPEDTALRRLGAGLLAERGERPAARRLLRSILARDTDDRAAWRDLAALEDDPAAMRSALQAAVLLSPEDAALRRRFLVALLHAGQHPEAIRQARHLMAAATPTTEDHHLAVRAALALDDLDRARAWLPSAEDGSVEAVRLAARVALAADDLPALRVACDALIERDAADGRLLIWVAGREREAGDYDRAALLLKLAAGDAEPAIVDLAVLHLAHLHLVAERPQRALETLLHHFGEDDEHLEATQLRRAARARLFAATLRASGE